MSQRKKKQRSPFPAVPTAVPVSRVSPLFGGDKRVLPVVPLESTEDIDPGPDLGCDPKSADPLVDEVQAFLRQRQELAQRLAEEIAATEAKLDELRKTAALLAPESSRNSPGAKDRKGKKPPRAQKRLEKSTAGEANPELPSDN